MKDYLVAFDSDGCVFDAMEIKHRRAFGPAAVRVYGLQCVEREFLEQWYYINLYSKTRGINRFPGLAAAMDRMRGLGYDVKPQESLRRWCNQTVKLSAARLKEDAERSGDPELMRALAYSDEVNRLIGENAHSIPVFKNVKSTFDIIKESADIAVVSSANTAAIEREWRENGLLDYICAFYGQESGNKKDCLALLRGRGYKSVLMVGDAPGDMQAAEAGGCLFYPIIPGDEEKSWICLRDMAFFEFLAGRYANENRYIAQFNAVCR
ncbi:MAG: HAD hydrolase-like protein [Defluviitaleaceae bacterium]|nr:HAD hydrolase-like protein [Defluviitaleaceae bacterium]